MADRKGKKVKQRSGFIEVLNALLTLLVVAVVVVGGVVAYGAHSYFAAGPIKQDTNYVVEKGANLGSVAHDLEAKGLIDSQLLFEIAGWISKKRGALKAGEFRLTAGSSMADVLKELTEGKPVLFGITIPEGFTMAQVVDRLNRDTQLTGDLTDIPPEGGILPQTYNYTPGSTRQAVLDQMAAAEKKALAKVWAGRDPDLPISTPEQLVVLASMVEKETGVNGERPKVAAVFVNRLKKHMRLQSDPTIIYGITQGKAPLGRPLKRSEVEAATPYNTYQVDGLPPTPIANPGMDALKAAANPAKTNDIYFVAATTNPSDGHLFSATYAEHRRNVAKLRVAQRQLAAANAEAEADAAKDAIDQQQAAAAGDTSADTSTPAAGTDQTSPGVAPAPIPNASAAPAAAPSDATAAAAPTATPTAPAAATPTAADTSAPAPATDTTPAASNANAPPVPMPADARPASTVTTPASQPTAPSRSRIPATPTNVFGG